MADYRCAIRTNYFHVKDEDAFRSFMKTVYGAEDIMLWEEKDADGGTMFGFGTYGGISGLLDYEDNDIGDFSSYDMFIDGLQKLVADDDAIIILEVGNEKLRYFVGSATIITSTNYEYMDITHFAAEKAQRMLGNAEWTTQLTY